MDPGGDLGVLRTRWRWRPTIEPVVFSRRAALPRSTQFIIAKRPGPSALGDWWRVRADGAMVPLQHRRGRHEANDPVQGTLGYAPWLLRKSTQADWYDGGMMESALAFPDHSSDEVA